MSYNILSREMMSVQNDSLLTKALKINELKLIKNLMRDIWEVESTESDSIYEVTKFVDETGGYNFSCGCPSYKFSDTGTCKHCVAVAIFEKGYINIETVLSITRIQESKDDVTPEEIYREVNSNKLN